jgi:hypothetical protein
VPDLLALVEVLGDDILVELVPLRPGLHRVDAIECDPDRVDALALMGELETGEVPHITGVFPLHGAFRVVLGAQIPHAVLSSRAAVDKAKQRQAHGWLVRLLKTYGLKQSKLEGWRFMPAMRVQDLQSLRHPAPRRWAPVAPKLKTSVRGPWMDSNLPRLVVDPSSLRVTVACGPLAVLFPLRLLVSTHAFGPDDGWDYVEEQTAFKCFRTAAFLASSFAQQWMEGHRRYWFSRTDDPLLDVPIPSRLWVRNDSWGRKIEDLGRRTWRQKPNELNAGGRWQRRLDELVNPVLAELRVLHVERA